MSKIDTFKFYTEQFGRYVKLFSIDSKLRNTDKDFSVKVTEINYKTKSKISEIIDVICGNNEISFKKNGSNVNVNSCFVAFYPKEYNPSLQYMVGDCVEYNKKIYSLTGNLSPYITKGISPDDSDKWKECENYTSKSYTAYSMVLYKDGNYYIANKDTSNEPLTSDDWDLADGLYSYYVQLPNDSCKFRAEVIDGQDTFITLYPFSAKLVYVNPAAINASTMTFPKCYRESGRLDGIIQSNQLLPSGNSLYGITTPNSSDKNQYIKIINIKLSIECIGGFDLNLKKVTQSGDNCNTTIRINFSGSNSWQSVKIVSVGGLDIDKEKINIIACKDSSGGINIFIRNKAGAYSYKIENFYAEPKNPNIPYLWGGKIKTFSKQPLLDNYEGSLIAGLFH